MSGSSVNSQIRGLHHAAFRCRDSEETRAFYEDFLGLPLSEVLEIGITKTGREAQYLHCFFRMDDGSYLAFFEAPDMPFEFPVQHDFNLHIALEVSRDHLRYMREAALERGMECRGISNHTFIESIYLRDPNGYVVELACKTEGHDEQLDPSQNGARKRLDRWTKAKRDAGIGPDVLPGFGQVKTGADVVGTAGEQLEN